MAERTIITVEELTQAIKNSPNNKANNTEMGEEQASELAQHVLNFFGYSDRIIDNVLQPEDRDAFYMLEDATILTTEREETTLYDGREWRIHYWLFRREKIHELMKSTGSSSKEKDDAGSIYGELPDDIWQRGGSS